MNTVAVVQIDMDLIKMNWISVKDRLPEWKNREDCKDYLVYLNSSFGCRYAVWLYTGEGVWWREDIDALEDDAVTHWMPLPEPPKEDK